MTPEDYRRLREMEIALGWEPSEPPTPEAELPAESPQAACDCGKCDGSHEGPAMRWFRDTRRQGHAPSGSGTSSAPMTGPGGRWRPVSELSEMQQAGDGATPEGIPAGPLIENMRRELEAQRRLDKERWEQR